MTPVVPSWTWGPHTPTWPDGTLARGGLALSVLRTYIDADLATMDGPPTANVQQIFVDATVNGMLIGGGGVVPQWQTDLAYIVDALHTKYPNATVYIDKPCQRGVGGDCNTLAGYIDTIIAARSPWALAGLDERTWLENGDDYATYTADGVHYNAAGHARKAALLKALIGY